MDASVEAVDGDIVLKFKNFQVEEGGVKSVPAVLRTKYMHLLTLLVRGMARTGAKKWLNLA